MPIELILVIALISIGIIFLLVEIFLLPGTTIAGIAGGILLIAGIVYAYVALGATAGNISIAVSVVVIGGLFTWFVRSKAIKTIGLKSAIEETVDNSHLRSVQVGDTGVTLSRLNPMGKVMIADVEMEGKSFDNEFIPVDVEVEVVKVNPMNVWVKRVESGSSDESKKSSDKHSSTFEPAVPLSERLRSGKAEQLVG